ncbi:hypothetical protein EVAR_49563_1 [Eumeta japonica]|uniref:Uncharacterized protein n=1 Tax=Eumeta variegata TaxID=151549 RepID=A0A4C1XJA6_EUMVA|nr:hypothetical protein EVAR_49563_1 [Eumeta japonica]
MATRRPPLTVTRYDFISVVGIITFKSDGFAIDPDHRQFDQLVFNLTASIVNNDDEARRERSAAVERLREPLHFVRRHLFVSRRAPASAVYM